MLPMSLMMKKALQAARRQTPEQSVDVLVRIGLIPESKRAASIRNMERTQATKKTRRIDAAKFKTSGDAGVRAKRGISKRPTRSIDS